MFWGLCDFYFQKRLLIKSWIIKSWLQLHFSDTHLLFIMFAFWLLEQKLFLLCMWPKELHYLYNKWKKSQRYQRKEEKAFIPQTTLETCNLLDLKSGFQNEAFSRTKIFARTSQVILHFDMYDLIWWNMKSWNYDLHFKDEETSSPRGKAVCASERSGQKSNGVLGFL